MTFSTEPYQDNTFLFKNLTCCWVLIHYTVTDSQRVEHVQALKL